MVAAPRVKLAAQRERAAALRPSQAWKLPKIEAVGGSAIEATRRSIWARSTWAFSPAAGDGTGRHSVDHYLGKEFVLNLTTLRFGNQLFEAVWNKDNIASVQIVFKEDLGTGGRGGYFDKFGIIRDIMQNHLLQVLLWFAMEPPKDLTRDEVRQEKVKLLKAVRTLKMENPFIGQCSKKGGFDVMIKDCEAFDKVAAGT